MPTRLLLVSAASQPCPPSKCGRMARRSRRWWEHQRTNSSLSSRSTSKELPHEWSMHRIGSGIVLAAAAGDRTMLQQRQCAVLGSGLEQAGCAALTTGWSRPASASQVCCYKCTTESYGAAGKAVQDAFACCEESGVSLC